MDRAALLLHVLGVVIWVGGMFFAYMALRPAAVQTLEPPHRLPLWAATFQRFFPWVWGCVVAILASGLYLMNVLGVTGLHVHIMLALGIVMMMIFAHVFFAPFRRLKRGVAAQEWKAAGAALAQIRVLVGVNLSIGIIVIFTGTVGRVLF